MSRSTSSNSCRLALLSWGVALCAALRGDAAPPPKDSFEARYQEAARLYEERRYDEAFEALQAAYALQPFPRLLYNLAQVQRRRGNLAQALDRFELYLRTEPNLQPERKAEVEGHMDQLKKELARIEAERPPPPLTWRVPTPPPPKLLVRPLDRPLYRQTWFLGLLGAGTAFTIALVAGAAGAAARAGALPEGVPVLDPTWQ